MYCSINPRVLSGRLVPDLSQYMKIGDIIEHAKVIRSDRRGVKLLLPNDCFGFCSANKLRDKPMSESDIMKAFPVGSRVTCRIIHANLMDQMYVVSLKKSIIAEEAFGRQNMTIGEKFKVKVLEHNNYGAVVTLGHLVKGFVPKIHLTDSNMKNPELKCPVGSKFLARIIRHTPGEDPHLTLKSELVRSTLPLVSDFEESNQGVITMGTIVKVYPGGLLVELCGSAKAFIPSSMIPVKLNGGDLASVFDVGSIVKCKISSVDAVNSRLVATLNFGVGEGQLSLRSIVQAEVYSVEEESVTVMIKDTETLASIPNYHLADDAELAKSVFKLLKKGDELHELVVFGKQKSVLVLSAKASILQAVKRDCGYENSDFVRGEVLPSVITEIHSDCIQVSVMKGKFGAKVKILKSNMFSRPKFREVPHTGIRVGQTLFVKCISVTDKMAVLSSTMKHVLRNKERTSLQILYNTIALEGQIQDSLATEFEEKSFKKVKIGRKYSGTVIAFTKVGALVHIPDLRLDGVVLPKHYDEGKEPVINSSINVRVLRINHKENCLELTARRSIKKLSSKESHGVTVDMETTAEILLPKKEYIIARLMDHDGHLVYLPAKRHMNDFKGRTFFYEIGKQYSVKIKYVEGHIILADLLDHCKGTENISKIDIEVPKIIINSAIPSSALSPLTLEASRYLQKDFLDRARSKIERTTQHMKMKKKIAKTLHTLNLMSTLKSDTFSEFDDDLFWDTVLRGREVRREATKLGLNKGKKRASENGAAGDEKRRKMKAEVKMEDEEDEDEEEEEEEEEEVENVASLQTSSGCLEVDTKGFDWTGQILNGQDEVAEEESSEDEETDKNKEQKTIKKLSRFERKLKAKTEERKTRLLELQRLDPNREPETALDYEEKIERNPHSSSVWIQYVSFYLENAETEKARGIAARALEVIPSTMEEERLAVWNVVLRLEVMYGTQETIQTAFKEAIVTNDELKIFYTMLDIYENANKIQEANEIIKLMTKKFSQNKEVWIKTGLFYFNTKEIKKARDILDKSLLSLPKSDHIEIINRFAQFEMKFGEAERGKTIFEKLLSNFPKRLDIWNVFADLLVKQGDIQGARNVFERMVGLKLKMKAMRTVFKKMLEFEKQHGTPQRVEAVKKRVEEYVAAALKDEE